MVDTTRVAFVDLPRLLREIIVALLRTQEMPIEVCAEELDERRLPDEIAAGHVDVLISGPALVQRNRVGVLLEAFPRLKALVVLEEGERAVLYELRPSAHSAAFSAQRLVEAVEAAQRHAAYRFSDTSPV